MKLGLITEQNESQCARIAEDNGQRRRGELRGEWR